VIPGYPGINSVGVTGKPLGVRQPVYVVFSTVEANLFRRELAVSPGEPGGRKSL